ncbi:MAG TPA: DUF305 domain-containing protein [Ilumatobacteraceae bacterium]|nr:DUF305 domain-containing protein [Ilumatobacteraceae bacterium]
MTARISRRGLLLAVGAGAVGAAGGAVVASARLSADAPNAADIGFCIDMSTHHVQAMAICQRVLGRDTGDPVQAAASEVLQTQSIEVGMMRAWLADWGESTGAPDTVMAWMGMNWGEGIPVDAMTGYVSDDEMRALSLAEGTESGRMWLELMRAHHVGGVHMATAAGDLADVEKVRRLARTQVDVQTYEIEQYDLLLATEYA